MRICVQFVSEQDEIHRRRLAYAFALFCAIYGHELCDERNANSADALISYCNTQSSEPPTVTLANLYRPRAPQVSAQIPSRYACRGDHTWLVHGSSEDLEPDWLGEIFEWVSCAHEYSITERDALGRVPFSASYCGTYKLDPAVPYAAVAMRFLQRAITRVVRGSFVAPLSPVSNVKHFVVNTHDIDFLPLGRWTSAKRLVKNSLISAVAYRLPGAAVRQMISAVSSLTCNHNPLDQIESLLRRERNLGISATYLFLAKRAHFRDANYHALQPEVASVLRSVEASGMEVGLHGSFTSLDQQNGLATECDLLRGTTPRISGNRQHWLRFIPERLIQQVEHCGLTYDLSYGWPNQVGFRGGACFPFPPYDFARERAAKFLEFPLVLMDVAVLQQRLNATQWFDTAARVLRTSRQYGWGGISVLWHNTAFGGGQVPAAMGKIFWQLIEEGKSFGDRWCSARDMLNSVRERYVNVGLM